MNNAQHNNALLVSRKNFAVELHEGPVSIDRVSKRLERTAALWLSRGEIVIVGSTYKLA